MISLVLLLSGLVLLAVGGDVLVQGAAAMARRLQIPDFLIGLTIVAFATSMPELLVALKSAWIGEAELAIDAVVGSNIANVLLVLGLPAFIAGTSCKQPLARRNYAFLLAVTCLFAAFCLTREIDFTKGAILFALLIGFLIVSVFRARDIDPSVAVAAAGATTGADDPAGDGAPLTTRKIVLFLLIGLICLPLGANLTVDGALEAAAVFALPKESVGLIVLALGTSLPELAAATAAAWRRESGLIIGSVLGSNIFNILSIIGIAAMVTPLAVGPHVVNIDMWIMLAVTLLLGPFITQRATIGRAAGLFFLALYAGFVYFVLAF